MTCPTCQNEVWKRHDVFPHAYCWNCAHCLYCRWHAPHAAGIDHQLDLFTPPTPTRTA